MPPPATRIRFAPDDGFHAAVRQRAQEHFRTFPGHHRPRVMLIKSLVILGALALAYAALLGWATMWWQAVPLAMLVGVLAALVGFNIQHDGGHQAYSRNAWRNRMAAATLDLIGASSYLWNWKHAVYHHGFANIAGHDTDITVGRLVRLEPHQPREAHHRWQHLYIWLLYGLMAMRWQLYDDLREVVQGAIGPHRIPRPRGREMAIFILGKGVFLGFALVLPMMLHPVWVVLGLYAVAASTLGVFLSVVFQLAHNTALCEFPLPTGNNGRIDHSWATHQLLTTANFSRHNPVATWFLGGLNYQIEHHLFPQVSHIHYPALSRIVEATCREHGLPYREHPSFFHGVAAHVRWLQTLGQPTPGT